MLARVTRFVKFFLHFSVPDSRIKPSAAWPIPDVQGAVFMVIDFHTHTFPDKIAAATVAHMSEKSRLTAYTDGSDAGLLASMRAAGVDLGVVLPVVTNPEKAGHINAFSAGCNGKTSAIHLGGMHPDTPDLAKEMKTAAALGLKGIKIHPVYQRTDIDDIRFLRLMEAAGENGLFVITHAGLDVGFPGQKQSSVEKIGNALRQVGPVPLVLAHMGGWRQWEAAEALAAFPNTYIDTAFSLGCIRPTEPGFYQEEELPLLDDERALRLIRAFGARRVLFGSDSPWADQADTLASFLRLPLTEEERELILYRNAAMLLKLEFVAALD